MSSGRHMHYSPTLGAGASHISMRSSIASSLEHDKYLAELLAERQKLAPFMQVLPTCSRLLNQALTHTSLGWNGAPGGAAVPVIKKTLKIEVPVDKYPSFNFVGRILGPRGNSLKRVEQSTGCRVMIRGRGSIKDTAKEEKMRDKPGYEHLNEPLHILVEAELPASVVETHLKYAREILQEFLKPPVDETMDAMKKAQLRELAILNGTLREDSPGLLTGATTPFNNPGMKRPKHGSS
ncbi:hypothetical protein O6H91_04G043200 [Diphasiastrum complanatum]|uniref:Uncharacterized protein n=1 Tax=Diphasiastrum complanatum TaxID=34168 RepID=A0ACC2DWB5_DIPCM|nr:hypothetical protein O6H91_04G043200 [Diphasiastrum complanatum]